MLLLTMIIYGIAVSTVSHSVILSVDKIEAKKNHENKTK